MQISIKIALIVIIILLLVHNCCILRAVKKKNMRINYLIFWSIMGVMLVVALLIPNLIETISDKIGFELPINMIFSIAIFIILYLIFDLTILVSKEYDKNVMLIQELSILKKRVTELENNNETKEGERS